MGQQQPKPDLFDAQIEIRMASKQMKRESFKADKSEKAERKKVADVNIYSTQAIAKGQLDIAKIHAESAIKNKQNAISLERLGARLEAVADKIASANAMKNISEQLSRNVPLLQRAIKSMDKLGLGQSMEEFQKIFEDLEVKSEDMGQALDNVHQGSLDQNEVDTLIKQIADEHNLELGKELGSAGTDKIGQENGAKTDMNSLENRLNNLKQS